jgi:YYY domain-containing protein
MASQPISIESVTQRRWFVPLLVALIFAIGAYFRFVGQNWDDFTHLHPDERFLTQVAEAINGRLNLTTPDPAARAEQYALCRERYPDRDGIGDFFDSQCSNWYPKNVGYGLYVYGELPLFTVRIAAELTQAVHYEIARQTPDTADDVIALSWTSYNGIHLVGRSVSAVADLLSLLMVFVIGRMVYNKWVGVLAMALYAAAVLPIQLSHFWTTDAFTSLPVLIAMFFAIRFMRRAQPLDAVGFGVGMGMAIASRINVAPLFGVIVVAAIVHAMPAFGRRIARFERSYLLQRAATGVLVALIATLVVFRFANPHAFTGGAGILGVFNILPHRPFLDDVAQAQYLTSGQADFPPNHQWASRTPYVFAAQNIILWGMGVPLGLAGWLGLAWALWQIVRARHGWTRHVLIAAWLVAYFAFVGRLWVMTMRYYMPLYPFLALMAAWALWELCERGRRAFQQNPSGMARFAYRMRLAALIFVVAFTYLWAGAFTNIYRRQLTRVEASHWIYRNVPSAVSLTLQTENGEAYLINTPISTPSVSASVNRYTDGARFATSLPPLNAPVRVDRLIVNRLYSAPSDAQAKTFWAALATDAAGLQVLGVTSLSDTFSATEGLGKSYTLHFEKPIDLLPNTSYYLLTWSDGALSAVRLSLAEHDFTLADGEKVVANLQLSAFDNALAFTSEQASTLISSNAAQANFTAPLSGVIRSVDLAHVLNPLDDGRAIPLRAAILDAESGTVLGEGTLRAALDSVPHSPHGRSVRIALDQPIAVKAEQRLRVQVSTLDGSLARLTGSVIATEGPWDDPVPQKVCALPPELPLPQPPGLHTLADCRGIDPWGTYYRGVELYMAMEDDLQKREVLQKTLDEADYITISSNRFYDSLSRIPTRFPMSIAFYDALFKGELGYDLIAVFNNSFEIFGIPISDQHLPFYESPAWLNEFEAEEAFHVYDHPAVLIFRKNPERYAAERVAAVLSSVPLDSNPTLQIEDATIVNVIPWGAYQASQAPTAFMMTDDLRQAQESGGTWSELFNREALINTSPVLSVALWWLTIMAFGWAIAPLLFVLLPALPDRAYPMAKISGMLVVAWLAWAGGTLRLPLWSSGGLLLLLIGVALLSARAAWSRRAELIAWLRLNGRYVLIVEAITATLFVAFVFVRLGNPDLWAQTLGGEKPMNFAYFNAVLRSSVFPAYDPWYAGGYLNYYYFGYVLVGAPTKLLGVMPSIAYNLIVPTLFALTGIGAFSLAFNLAAARWRFPREEGSAERSASLRERLQHALRTPAASPYMAGTLALLLCVVLGNLDTPRVFLTGVQRAGGCASTSDMYLWKLDQFVAQNGRQPTPEESADLLIAAQNPSLVDQALFGFYNIGRTVECFGRGIGQLTQGAVLPIGPERWYWGPRSVVGELPNNSNEINEFPYFTFVFGDLHAHMIALPITFLALTWLMSEVFVSGKMRRATWIVIAATALGGLSIGILRATNTWDWITYLLLGMAGLPFAILLRRHRLTRANVTAWIAQVVWLFIAQWLAALPFMAFHATSYSSVKAFLGNKTPIWAFFTMHGVFLFVVISLLVWQTARLLRAVYLRDLTGRFVPVALIVGGISLVVLLSLFMAIMPLRVALVDMPIPLAIVLVPLIAWSIALFFVPNQTREWQVVYVLIGAALAIALGVEIVVLDGDIGRQNTFFKFYMQVWMMLSVASGVGLAWLLYAAWRWRPAVRSAWLFTAALLLSIAALFPIMSTQGKNAMRMAPEAPRTLNGNDYMMYAVYYEGSQAVPLKRDLAMIKWLQDNVQGTPTIVEAHQYPSEYKYNSRIAINTGLPTILGWRFHQQQQRTLDPLPSLVIQRQANVTALYNTLDIGTAWQLLRFYNVRYIIVGELERITYRQDGLAKFEAMVAQGLLEVVYDQDGDKIYRVIEDAQYTPRVVGMQRK